MGEPEVKKQNDERFLVKLENGHIVPMRADMADAHARRPGHAILLIPPPDVIEAGGISPTISYADAPGTRLERR